MLAFAISPNQQKSQQKNKKIDVNLHNREKLRNEQTKKIKHLQGGKWMDKG